MISADKHSSLLWSWVSASEKPFSNVGSVELGLDGDEQDERVPLAHR
jgi:hypothetical protein